MRCAVCRKIRTIQERLITAGTSVKRGGDAGLSTFVLPRKQPLAPVVIKLDPLIGRYHRDMRSAVSEGPLELGPD